MREIKLQLILGAVVSIGCVPASASRDASRLWDDLESHEWIGEDWGGSEVTTEHVDFEGRRCLRVNVGADSTGFGIVRTKRFMLEDWRPPIVALVADVYVVNRTGIQLKLEVRGKEFDPPLLDVISPALDADQWQTITWILPATELLVAVGSLTIVIDNVGDEAAELYLDDLRLLTESNDELGWDQMDDARLWFYFGKWFDWSCDSGGFPGIEPISSLDGSPESPTSSLYLEWGSQRSQVPALRTAEIGTNSCEQGLDEDFSDVDRIGLWVRVSSADIVVRVFFFDFDQQIGFQTPSVLLQQADTWQEIVWSIPWPPDFDRADVDEIKFVVDGIDGIEPGWVRFDQVELYTDDPPPVLDGQITVVTNYDAQCKDLTQLGGNFGELNRAAKVDRVDIKRDHEAGRNESQAALRVDFFDLPGGFAGVFNSWIGRSDRPEFALDLTQWEYLRFYVRGTGDAAETYTVKLEIKEARLDGDSFNYTAYTYFTIDGGTSDWAEVVVSLDLTDNATWSYNQFVPDATRAKEFVFVLEEHFNPSDGTFFVDDIELIDTDVTQPPIDKFSTDEQVLSYFLETNFNYFLYAVHPESGQVLDRLSSSDLATVAGNGFALSAWCLGAEIDLITKDEAYAMAERTLNSLASAPMGWTDGSGDEPQQQGQVGANGFLYHFLDSATTTRAVVVDEDGQFVSGSELSSVDTTLCVFGVTTCRQAITVEHGYTPEQEAQIAKLAEQILTRIQWPFFVEPDSEQVYLGWKPEMAPGFEVPHHSGVGYVAGEILDGGDVRIFTWDYTTDEILLIALAAMAAPEPENRLAPSIMSSWARIEGTFGKHTLIQTWPGSAFTYQFANLWLPLSELPCDRGGVDWWQNAREALWANLDFCMRPEVVDAFDSFDGTGFGLTACEDPSGRYKAFGAPPSGECKGADDEALIGCFLEHLPDEPNRANGTLAPYGAAAAIELLQLDEVEENPSVAALKNDYFALGLWNNLFGFPDSYHLNVAQLLTHEPEIDGEFLDCLEAFGEEKWWNPVQFAIDQGPIVLALGNYLHGGLLKQWIASDPDIARALREGYRLAGDIDCNGALDLLDYAAFQACATGPGGGPIEPSCESFDFDNDADVDLLDFRLMQAAFTGGS